MDGKFTKKEIEEITKHFKAFVGEFDNTLKSEVKIEDENVLVLSFTCEEKQYRNYKKDRVLADFNFSIFDKLRKEIL